MAKIHTAIAFGVMVEITSPILPDKGMLESIMLRAQTALNAAFIAATSTTLKLLPGVKVSLTDAKTMLAIDHVEP